MLQRSRITAFASEAACANFQTWPLSCRPSSANKATIQKAEKLVQQRGPVKGKRQSLNVIYYDASSAKVWG
jgi:hypothetical protein